MNDSKSVTGGSCVSYAALLILFVIIRHKFVYTCFYLSGFVFFCLDLFFGNCVMSCLACSLPRLVGLLGLFNSPYPSRTPKLSQWSDRPRRVGLGPQLLFLSRGSLTVRDSVVGRRWGFILCGCLSSTWCAHWDGILLTDCRGGHCDHRRGGRSWFACPSHAL